MADLSAGTPLQRYSSLLFHATRVRNTDGHSYLQMVSRLTARPAPVLADVPTAYLVRAERTRAPRDL